ncbi:putative flavin dependent monooxygenase [Aureobasidium sp. EXF-10727]|nr:putative flavin dependent monooxygenase [Aureobasidium sp. EXF-10727]
MFSPDYFHTASAPKLQDYHDYAQAHIRDRRISLSPLAKKWLRNYREPYKGFTSDGNIVPGLWRSNHNANGPTQAMVDAAQYLLSVASANEKARFRHLVTAREWRAWSNPEVIVMECGLRVDAMSADTMNAVYELLRVSLSPKGFERVWTAMMMAQAENQEDLHRISGYQFCLFGEPGPFSPWGFNLFGDNVCVNVFTLGGEVVIGPFFVSAGPSFTEQGLVDGVQVFEREEAAGLALMASLNPQQQREASLSGEIEDFSMDQDLFDPMDYRSLGGAHQDNRIVPYEGICAADLNYDQQRALLNIVRSFNQVLPQDSLDLFMQRVESHLDETYFSWLGPVHTDAPFYFRIHSPVVMDELDHQDGIMVPGTSNKQYRIHATQRLPNRGDYGAALLDEYLLAEKAFERIDIYEQRSRVGGIWDYSPEDKTPDDLPVPSVTPHAGLAKPKWLQSGTRKALGSRIEEESLFLSPLYDRLETNIPRTLMGFSDFDWPQDSQLFPKHETVTQYLEDYAADIKHLIHFNTQVLDINLAGTKQDGQDIWSVKTQKVQHNTHEPAVETKYDAVVVANGHFAVPFIPQIKGMKEWAERYPNAISHSMYYKKPEDYTNLKTIVVGSGASGIDIAMQLMQACKLPLIQSQKSKGFLLSDPTPKKQEREEIVDFIIQDRAVRFADGTVEKDIDCILFCTGYFYSYPFLNNLDPPLVTSGTHVQNLYQHLVYRPHPTLCLPTLQQRVIPFPMAESQSAVIARLWNNRISLPSVADMKTWEQDLLSQTNGGGRDFHLLLFPKDADYINAMYDWSMSASDAETKGKRPPRWGEKQYWMREKFPEIKKAFQDRGEGRRQVRTLEELGFDFEEMKKEARIEQKSLL